MLESEVQDDIAPAGDDRAWQELTARYQRALEVREAAREAKFRRWFKVGAVVSVFLVGISVAATWPALRARVGRKPANETYVAHACGLAISESTSLEVREGAIHKLGRFASAGMRQLARVATDPQNSTTLRDEARRRFEQLLACWERRERPVDREGLAREYRRKNVDGVLFSTVGRLIADPSASRARRLDAMIDVTLQSRQAMLALLQIDVGRGVSGSQPDPNLVIGEAVRHARTLAERNIAKAQRIFGQPAGDR